MDAIIKSVLFGQGERYAQVGKGETGYDPTLKPYPYDVRKARDLLRQAGFPNGFDTPCYLDKAKKPTASGLVVHDRAAQSHFPRVLDQLGAKFQGYGGNHWSDRLTKKTPVIFINWLQSLPPEIQIELDHELATLRDAPVSGSVSLDVQEAGIDWFDLKVVLNVADTNLTQEELKLLLNVRGGYVRLGSKGWRRLKFDHTPEEDEQLARLGLNAKDFTAEPQRFHALQLADDAAKKFLTPDRVEKISRRVSDIKTRVTPV